MGLMRWSPRQEHRVECNAMRFQLKVMLLNSLFTEPEVNEEYLVRVVRAGFPKQEVFCSLAAHEGGGYDKCTGSWSCVD